MLESYIMDVPDFPKKGIVYKDITPLLANDRAMKSALQQLADHYSNYDFDYIAGAESRGFIFGIGLSQLMGKGFIPIRKPGKLPRATHRESYGLEYGEDTLEIHQDAVKPGEKVLLVDDLLATGGTMEATIKLMKKCGAEVVGCGFLIELSFLNGRDSLEPVPVFSLIDYSS